MKAELTIELVPQSCWYSNVRSNVSKETWDTLRKQVYRRADYHCEICGGQGDNWPVECHEIWYYDDKRKVQRLEGLIALCPSCHEVKHIGLAGSRGRGSAAAAHLARVNGWSERQARRYIVAAFELWEKRSGYEWALDLSWLKNKE